MTKQAYNGCNMCMLCLVFSYNIQSIGSERSPNILLILIDDMGYGDLASFGNNEQEVGAIDQLAHEGMMFTNMYSAGTYCTPSRAALLTGRQPWRSGMYGETDVLRLNHNVGLPHSEVTIAEGLRTAGYKTGIVGKWHLGINKDTSTDGAYLPHTQGFDYVGTILPWSLVSRCDTNQVFMKIPHRQSCIVYRNTSIIQQPIELNHLTENIIVDSKAFLYDYAGKQPYFLFLSFPQAHSPVFSMSRFQNTSKRGPYGDMINELSWAVGEVVETVKMLDNNTLILLASDHGPHLELCQWGGKAGKFKGGKGTFYEGGVHVPAIAWWSGVITPGTQSHDLLSLMDVFPTLLQLGGASDVTPMDRIIDGVSFAHTLQGKPQRNERSVLYFYEQQFGRLAVARYKHYKIFWLLHAIGDTHVYCDNGIPFRDYYWVDLLPFTVLDKPVIFDLSLDPGEEMPITSGMEYDAVLADINLSLRVEELTYWDSRKPLLVKSAMDSSVVPCCNPPFCFCNFPFKDPLQFATCQRL